MSLDLVRLEAQARQAEAVSDNVSGSSAELQAAISAAELYLQALQLADNAVDRRRLDIKCRQLVTRAESIRNDREENSVKRQVTRFSRELKVPKSSRKLTTRENIIILEGSKLNGFLFKPWQNEPDPEDFQCRDGESMFVDSAALPLSQLQMQSFAGWKRPPEALASIELQQGTQFTQLQPTMISAASLCAGVSRVAKGHPKLLRTIIYPYDNEKGTPSFSTSGRYILKLNFNGCLRRVEIDDFLPTSRNSRVLHVVDRLNPGLVWPALVEKAYLKVRGGYDFPGSNSGTDLAILTGWIPQQVFLHDEDIEQEELWKNVFSSFQEGNILVTMGTGKLPKREQRLLGLAAEHDYAVLDMKDDNGVREMLIKNPWSDGDVWRGATRRRENSSHGSEVALQSLDGQHSEMTPGTFWMDFGSVFQHFENIYMNWNPGLFAYREDIHFSWDLASSNPCTNLFTNNPQFALRSAKGGKVWVLLSRHFKTGDYTQASVGKNGYISLYIHKKDGFRVILSDGAMIRGPFVDSPNTLIQLDMPPQSAYTVVVTGQDLPTSKCNFSLSSFSDNPLQLSEAFAKYQYEVKQNATWARNTAGGNSDSPQYLNNPQFGMEIQSSTDVALLLCVNDGKDNYQKDVHVKILVVFSDGHRITKLRPRDVVANSGDYRRSSAVIQTTLDKGSYTIICSTFDRDQQASFSLTLCTATEQLPKLVPLPSINSGRLSIVSNPATFNNTTNRLLAPVAISRITKSIFIARPLASPTAQSSSSLFKISLEQGQGPYKHLLATSSVANDYQEYASISSHPQMGDLDLRPDMHAAGTGGLWLVLERSPQTCSPETNEAVEVEMLVEERVELGQWGRGDG